MFYIVTVYMWRKSLKHDTQKFTWDQNIKM